jgi:hypothetical protein
LYSTSPGWSFNEKEVGGVKAPGVTEAAIVIAVCGSVSLERSSQVVAAAAHVANVITDAASKLCW